MSWEHEPCILSSIWAVKVEGQGHISPKLTVFPPPGQRCGTVCLNSFGNRTSPSDNSNDHWKRLCLVSWTVVPCVWTLSVLTRNLLTYLLLGFTITHIHIKLHQCMISSFSVFACTERQTDGQRGATATKTIGDGYLRVKWPDQQRQSTEGRHKTKLNQIQQNTRIHLNQGIQIPGNTN